MLICILDTYQALNLLLQTVIGLAIVATFIIYYLQLHTMRSASNGQNMLSIINLLQDTEVRKARETVIQQLQGTDFKTWNADQRKAASKVVASYDIASILVYQQKIVKDDTFLKNWGPSIVNCYVILKDFIAEMQKDENSGPNYWNDYKILYEKMKKTTNYKPTSTIQTDEKKE